MATSGNSDDGSGIYDFKDNKTTGTVTITKKWDDGLTNAEREIPDMYLSTEKPSKSTKGYTVTFHGNGLKFANGTDENMVVYNSSGQIVEGSYKEAVGTGVAWYANKACTQKIELSDDGVPQVELTGDLDLWAKEMTFEIKGYNSRVKNYNEFNAVIPDTVTEIIFTDEAKPKTKEVIDVDADEDSGVVAWLDDDAGTVMKVSTQIQGVKVQAAKASGNMFYGRSQLQKIDLKMLDTQKVTDMDYMFYNCSGLTGLDLTPLNTSNVKSMEDMFYDCSGLTSLDLTSLDTQKVTYMDYMFSGCSGLANLDLTSLDTQKVTDMSGMFDGCYNLTELDLSNFDTSNVVTMGEAGTYSESPTRTGNGMFQNCKSLKKLIIPFNVEKCKRFGYMFYNCCSLETLDLGTWNTINAVSMNEMFYNCKELVNLNLSFFDTSHVERMYGMFDGCSELNNIDLSSFDTSNVLEMNDMFSGCSALTSLDLSSFNTKKVTNAAGMFSGCSSLTSLNLASLDTSKVTKMDQMFFNCSSLTILDLTTLDTRNVTSMGNMFYGCSALTSLDLSSLDTSKVTYMGYIFYNCSSLTNLTTGPTFKFVGTNYNLSGTWQNTAGKTFTTGTFPSNIADTYTKVSS